ncbi:MAG: hypothetical protein Tsb0020_06420 [Haliangiales bacterium]
MQLTCELHRRPTSEMLWRFLNLELKSRGRRLLRRVGVGRPGAIRRADVAPPDSALATRADALVRSLSPDYLYNHCLRTYAFGVAIGRHRQLRWDHELFFIAAALHDLGLTEAHAGPGSFELEGARAARAFGVDSGMSAERCDLLHEAIALHTSVGVAHLREPEIALVHLGAGMDVIGVAAEDIDAATVADILDIWPREGFKERFVGLLEREVAAKPESSIAGHMRLGFAARVRRAPFAE